VQLPAPDPKVHQLKIFGQVACAATGGGWPLTMRAVACGYPDYSFREAERDDRSGGQPLLAMNYRPVAGAFALEKQTATPASALDEDFAWEAKGSGVGLSARIGKQQVIHAPFWLPQEWDLALHERQAPLFLNQGYPLALDEAFVLALPSGANGLNIPSRAENKNDPLRWRVEWTSAGADKVRAQFHAEVVRGELNAGDTVGFQRELRGLLAAMAADASFSPAE